MTRGSNSVAADLDGLEPLATSNTNETIQQRLIAFIVNKKLIAGDRLPPEGGLTRALSVSRAALREAMRSMEALGIIEARAGSGWYVQRFSFDSVAKGLALNLELNRRTLADLNEIRICLEGSYLIHAMRTLTPDDLESLQGLVDEMEKLALAGRSFAVQDRQFHQILFSRIRNQVFKEMMDIFWTLYIYVDPELMPAGDRVADAREHGLILDAIRAGDPVLARQRLEDSLKGAVRRIPPVGNQ